MRACTRECGGAGLPNRIGIQIQIAQRKVGQLIRHSAGSFVAKGVLGQTQRVEARVGAQACAQRRRAVRSQLTCGEVNPRQTRIACKRICKR